MTATHKAIRDFRKPTNLSLDASLLEKARSLGINISRACEHGLAAQITEIESERWREENMEAINSSNEYVACNGLPLAKFRQF
jgi:antitoxin CcdA